MDNVQNGRDSVGCAFALSFFAMGDQAHPNWFGLSSFDRFLPTSVIAQRAYLTIRDRQKARRRKWKRPEILLNVFLTRIFPVFDALTLGNEILNTEKCHIFKTWLKIMTSLERSESQFSADAFLFNVPLNLFNWPFRLHHVMIFGHATNLWFSIWLSLDRIGIKFTHTHTYTHSCNSETWGPPRPHPHLFISLLPVSLDAISQASLRDASL